jgi:type IV pilus assembly protein PilB
VLSPESQQKLEAQLLAAKLVSQQGIDEAQQAAAKKGISLGEALLAMRLIDEESLTKELAKVVAVEYANLQNFTVPATVLGKLPRDTAEKYSAVPFGYLGERLAVAMIDPSNIPAVDFLTRKIGEPLAVFQVSRSSLNNVLAQFKGDVSADISAAIDTTAATEDPDAKQAKEQSKEDAKELQTLVQDAPITRALNTILEHAVTSGASDIHVEPREQELKIRYRIDGVLQEVMTLPKAAEPALISRIKILSNLKIDEHRVPQDGEFQIHFAGKDVDLRIAISPVVHGEQVVIRLLDKSSTLLTLDSLGFRGRALRLITEGIHRPHGMTLSTGPTGSGKSTTLYAAIQAIKDASINIVTLEDPVEYKMDGINQIQVNAEVGLTFASGLRSILRQDPNVIMVGEIRDKETADLAVQAALTGHVVLSTLHTNSAAGVLPRMLDMGVEPFLVASTINTVIGQRLVRKICDKCKVQVKASAAQVQMINNILGKVLPGIEADKDRVAKDLGYENLPLKSETAYTLYMGKGCNACVNGYKGRLGIYEVFAMSPAIEKLLAAHSTTTQIQDQAMADGMITMQQDGMLKVLTGLTTIEEVARVATDS